MFLFCVFILTYSKFSKKIIGITIFIPYLIRSSLSLAVNPPTTLCEMANIQPLLTIVEKTFRNNTMNPIET